MTADSVLVRAQAAAIALMVDTGVIRRRSTQVVDPETGIITQLYSTIYTGICRVQRRTMFDRPRDAGQAFELMLAVEVQIPVTVIGVAAEDIFTQTASLHDPDLVGRVFHIKGLSHRSHPSSRRLQCVEINS